VVSNLVGMGPLPEQDRPVLSTAHVQGQMRMGTQAPNHQIIINHVKNLLALAMKDRANVGMQNLAKISLSLSLQLRLPSCFAFVLKRKEFLVSQMDM